MKTRRQTQGRNTISVKEILAEAFAKVQAEHGISLGRVSFDLVEVSNDERECYVPSRIEIEGRAISQNKREYNQ